MSQPQNYKNRTVQVRSSARAHLKELRQERMNRRKAAVAADQPCAVAPEPPEEQDGLLTPESEVSEAFTESVAEPEESIAAQSDALDDLAVENAAMSEMVEEVAQPKTSDSETPDIDAPPAVEEEASAEDTVELSSQEVGPEDAPEPEATDSQEVHASGTDMAPEPSDLETLPGAGPGLVWMLQQVGVNSLADLAETTPEGLSKDLGVVGQILDVAQWIEFAKK